MADVTNSGSALRARGAADDDMQTYRGIRQVPIAYHKISLARRVTSQAGQTCCRVDEIALAITISKSWRPLHALARSEEYARVQPCREHACKQYVDAIGVADTRAVNR
jgi:hypothetical protein